MTLLTTLQALADEVGMDRPTTATESSDNARRQLRIARRAAFSILKEHPWSVLVTEATISGTGAAAYSLPTNFDRGIPYTFWNDTDSWRIRGSASYAYWKSIDAGWVSSTNVNVTFRITQSSGTRQISFDPAVDSGDTVVYDYVSKNMFDTGSGLAATWENDSDTCLVSEELVTQCAVWMMLRSLGRDWQAHFGEYRRLLAVMKAQDVPAEVIHTGAIDMVLPLVTPEEVEQS